MNRTTAQLLQGQGRNQNKLSGFTKAIGGAFTGGLERKANLEDYQKKADIDLQKSKDLSDYNRTAEFDDFVVKNQLAIKDEAAKKFVSNYGVTPEQRPDLWERQVQETALLAFDNEQARLKASTASSKATEGAATEAEDTRVMTMPTRQETAMADAETGLGLANGRAKRVPLTNRALDFSEIYKPAAQLQDLQKGEVTPFTPGVSYDIRPWQGGTRSMFRTPTTDEVLTGNAMGKPVSATTTASPFGSKQVGTKMDGTPLYASQENGDTIDSVISRFKSPAASAAPMTTPQVRFTPPPAEEFQMSSMPNTNPFAPKSTFGVPSIRNGKMESTITPQAPVESEEAKAFKYQETMKRLQQLLDPYTKSY